MGSSNFLCFRNLGVCSFTSKQRFVHTVATLLRKTTPQVEMLLKKRNLILGSDIKHSQNHRNTKLYLGIHYQNVKK